MPHRYQTWAPGRAETDVHGNVELSSYGHLRFEIQASDVPDLIAILKGVRFMKAGYKTSEFWLTMAATVVSALFASGAIGEGTGLDKVLGLFAMVLSALGYSVSRAQLKGKPPEPEKLP